MFNIKEELKKLPDKPGVYIMRDINDNILYVGKAVSLKNRVKQYFMKGNKAARTEKMVSLINRFEYIVTDTETEALILECNLIKEHRPKFNVLLKDDKTYPYIKVDVKNEFPNVVITRKILNDGAKYFGPYTNATAANEMVYFIKEKFQIRQCRNFKSNTRPCLNFHIKRCLAPCVNEISKEEYRELVNEIIMLLEGKTDKIIKKLDEDIKRASEKLEFEKAAVLRDRKNSIQAVTEKQKMSNISENYIDVIGIYKNELEICIEIFFVRNSKMVGREHYFLNNVLDMQEDEIVSSFIKQYYMEKSEIPSKIMIKPELQEKELLEVWLSKKSDRKVEIRVTKKGEKLKFVEMAEKNAQITLENKVKEKYNVLVELKETLQLDKFPNKIECYDISNISGTFIVAGMCVAKNGEINRGASRRFKIRTVQDQDDAKSMNEVIGRRLKHNDTAFGELPNLILVDGGIIQINAAKQAISSYSLNIPVFGMVKDNKHKTKGLLDENKNEIRLSENLFKFITNLQDEVHKTAIEYHKKLRDKEMVKSELDNIKGIGDSKKKLLLKEFKTIENIKNASVEELTKIKGINEKLAKEILNSWKG